MREEVFKDIGHDERYQNIEYHCRGGQKIIYKAFDLKTDRVVALAKIKENATEHEKALFLREAKINAFLQHPNIIPVYDIGSDGDELYFSMKFIHGEPLSDIISKLQKGDESIVKTYPLEVLIEIFSKICDAVAYAHSQGVWHLDLKPSNIQINTFGDVLVCDWGLSGLSDDQEDLGEDRMALEKYSVLKGDLEQMTMMGFAKGTPGYMSPEQTGQVKYKKSQRTDVYSLGVILYTILCFRAPYDGSEEEVIQKTVEGKPTSPKEVNFKISNVLEAICLKAMSLNPSDRYLKVSELCNEVSAYQTGYATYAEKADMFRLLYLLCKRNKVLCLSIIGMLSIVIVMSLFYVESLIQKKDEANLARLKAESHLEKYKSEFQMRQSLSDIGVDFFIKMAKEKMVLGHYDSAYELLHKIPKTEFDKDQLRELNSALGRISFITQRFQTAIDYLNKNEDHDSYLKNLSEIYKLKKNGEESLLQGQDLVELIETLKHEDVYLVRDLYLYVSKKYVSTSEFLKVWEAMVYIENTQLKSFNFKFTEDEKGFHLDISNNPLVKYLPALPNLNLYSLNLMNFKGEIHGQMITTRLRSLVKLNISGCEFEDYSFLKYCRNLKTIVVNMKESMNESFIQSSQKLKVLIQE